MSREQIKYVRLNGEAVRSILDNEKTQLRFAMNEQNILGGTMTEAGFLVGTSDHSDCGGEVIKPPYDVGDILAVKETWVRFLEMDTAKSVYFYRADGIPNKTIYDNNEIPLEDQTIRWEPSTRMPLAAARIYLRVINVRVERLQDITLEDIEREGIWTSGTLFPREDFAEWYNRSLPKKKREMYSWDKNPFVWVVTFERCEKPEVEYDRRAA